MGGEPRQAEGKGKDADELRQDVASTSPGWWPISPTALLVSKLNRTFRLWVDRSSGKKLSPKQRPDRREAHAKMTNENLKFHLSFIALILRAEYESKI